MMKSNKRWIVFGNMLVLAAAIAIVLSKERWLFIPLSQATTLHIVIENRSEVPVGPFVIIDERETRPMDIEVIEAGKKIDVEYAIPLTGGENGIYMRDSNGKGIPVAGYFEHRVAGRIDIRIECSSPNGYAGKIRQLLIPFFSFEWRDWGWANCDKE
jgi:hypothetical protein